jgi:hypothetical protein
MRPKFVAALTKASYKMMLQTGQGIKGILQRDMMAVLGEAFDLAALCDPVTYKTTKNTVKSSGDSVGFLAESDGSMNSYPLRATTHCPSNTVLFGTWSGATARFQVSDDNESFQHLTDEKGYAIGLYGDDFASLLDIPSGVYFRVVIADSDQSHGARGTQCWFYPG